jgi:antitoxin component of MazEF toxin-antitoxin module
VRTTVNLVQNGKSTAIIVPQSRLRELGWKRGDTLVVFVERGMLVARSLEADIEQHRRRAGDVIHEVLRESPA